MKKIMKHSPGPWFATEFYMSPVHKKAGLSDHWVITNLKGQGQYFATAFNEGDAKLIASAPDLKALLEVLVVRLQGPMNQLAPIIEEAQDLLKRLNS